MKSFLITSAAALLVAGAATAGDIQVLQEPGSNVRVIHVDTMPMTFTDTGDQGLLTADIVTDSDFGIPGFDADTVIYIWEDESGVRVSEPLLDTD